jgi:hypothetical protein
MWRVFRFVLRPISGCYYNEESLSACLPARAYSLPCLFPWKWNPSRWQAWWVVFIPVPGVCTACAVYGQKSRNHPCRFDRYDEDPIGKSVSSDVQFICKVLYIVIRFFPISVQRRVSLHLFLRLLERTTASVEKQVFASCSLICWRCWSLIAFVSSRYRCRLLTCSLYCSDTKYSPRAQIINILVW